MEWCLTLSLECGGCIRVGPYVCPCKGNWGAISGCKRWKPVDLGDEVCLRYLSRSEVLGSVGLFSAVVLDFWPHFLGCIRRGAGCDPIGTDSIGSVTLDGNYGVY